MLPSKNSTHVEEAQALLIGQFKGKPNIQGFLDSYIRRLQDVEDVLWDVIDSRILDNATGVQLDTLGNLVGEIRRGRLDSAYRVGIRIKIKVNRSKGRIVDVIDVATLANAPSVPVVEEHRYLNFHVETYEQIGERFLADSLSKTRAAGSYGCLVASDYPLVELLCFDDATDPDPSIETFSDAISGGKVCASCYGLPQDVTGGVLIGGDFTEPSEPIFSAEGEAILSEDSEVILSES